MAAFMGPPGALDRKLSPRELWEHMRAAESIIDEGKIEMGQTQINHTTTLKHALELRLIGDAKGAVELLVKLNYVSPLAASIGGLLNIAMGSMPESANAEGTGQKILDKSRVMRDNVGSDEEEECLARCRSLLESVRIGLDDMQSGRPAAKAMTFTFTKEELEKYR